MTDESPSGQAAPGWRDLQFYYFGFHRALIRYRFMTLLGWAVVLGGCAAIPLAWNDRSLHPLTDAGLAALLIVAGLALVQLGVSSLETYIHIPFKSDTLPESEEHPAIREIRSLMEDVSSGGWHEALGAVKRLNTLEVTHHLPPLSGSGRST